MSSTTSPRARRREKNEIKEIAIPNIFIIPKLIKKVRGIDSEATVACRIPRKIKSAIKTRDKVIRKSLINSLNCLSISEDMFDVVKVENWLSYWERVASISFCASSTVLLISAFSVLKIEKLTD